jgi:hypothetical protein
LGVGLLPGSGDLLDKRGEDRFRLLRSLEIDVLLVLSEEWAIYKCILANNWLSIKK